MRRPFSANLANLPDPTQGGAVTPAIQLPRDQYLHLGAPTEWWWHTGTLTAGNRVFGFEINAASFTEFGFTQVMLTDVANQKHYQENVVEYAPTFDPNTWAESDPSKPWFARQAKVAMAAPAGADPAREMTVSATLNDADSATAVHFDLKLSQEGPPFIVWGVGVTQKPTPPTLATNNYYYSLTRLHVKGTITIGKDPAIDVTGVTWMDHEYGLFKSHGDTPRWILQDFQLDNGTSISNFSLETPELNKRTKSMATVQHASGDTHFVETFVTPMRGWKSPKSGHTYFVELLVEIPFSAASLTVTTLMEAQEFYTDTPIEIAVYEGVATVKGTFEQGQVTGTAWIEQTGN